MERRIKIEAGQVSAEGTLNETAAARAIWERLPLEASANTWGAEIYFSIGVEAQMEHPQEVVKEGDLGYWPPGRAFCIFFGPTPVSRGDEIRPASAVEVVGHVQGDPTVFRGVPSGSRVRLARLE